MTTYEYRVKPQGKVLQDYKESWGRVELIMGPLGSAKTTESCQKIFAAMCNQAPNAENIRPSRFYAVRNTYPDLTTTTIKDWLELYEPLGRYTGGGLEPPTHRLLFKLEDGTTVKSELIFLALDRIGAVKKLRGSQATGFWLNEIKELNKAIVDMADLRHGRYPSMAAGGVDPTWHGMIGDTNAPDEDHWYYELAEEVKPKGWTFHRQPGGLIKQGETYILNPLAENVNNLPENYYIAGMEGKKKDWIDVNLCNEYGFVLDGKPVYPEYVDSVHCLNYEYIPDPNKSIRLGLDFGRTPACAFVQETQFGGYVGFDEFLSIDMSAAVFAPELKRYIDKNYPDFTFEVGGGDPSGISKGQATEDTPFKIMRKHGINVQPTHSNDPLLRRAAIINPMTKLGMDGKPLFQISPKCKKWRKGLAGGFVYKRIQVTGDERFHDEPDKNEYSHICEAGEYSLMQAGEGRKALKPAQSNFTQTHVAKVDFSVFD